MANPTTNYGWVLPIDGASNGAWGALLLDFSQAVDTAVFAVSAVASAALAKAGGVMTGRVDLKTASMARSDAGSVSGATNFDVAVSQYFTLTVGGALSPAFTNVPAGSITQGVVFRVTNGGAFLITWPSSVKWPGAIVPTLTAAGVDLLGFITDDNGTTWRGVVIGKDIR